MNGKAAAPEQAAEDRASEDGIAEDRASKSRTAASGKGEAGPLIQADEETRRNLSRLDGDPQHEMTQDRADNLLARIAWSRLAEPGDRTAGELLAAMGALPALELLVSEPRARRLHAAAREQGADGLSASALAAGLKRWIPRLDRAATLTDIERAAAAGVHVITRGDEAWPEPLEDLGTHSPSLLWVRGDPGALSSPSLAVVGARAATGYGSHVTAEITDGVCAAGFSVVSGAAYGIDAVAHRTALACGAPTVAVLAGGVDRPYPAAHTTLLSRIAEQGAVCSEMVPGSAPTRWRFLQRNRLIAALASAVLVTEASTRSGSLNTAGHAAELGRPLGTVPGPITSAASSGCHRLIRDYGATLVTNAPDALELLGYDDHGFSPGEDEGTDLAEQGQGAGSDGSGRGSAAGRQPAVHRRVIDALPLRGSRPHDEVARRSGLGVEETRGALAELELLGFVSRRETPGSTGEDWRLLRRE